MGSLFSYGIGRAQQADIGATSTRIEMSSPRLGSRENRVISIKIDISYLGRRLFWAHASPPSLRHVMYVRPYRSSGGVVR